MTTPHPGERPAGHVPATASLPTFRSTSRTASAALTAGMLLPVSALIVIVLPTRAALALLVLAAIIAGVTRTGLWVLGDRPRRDATLLAIRAGAVALAVGVGLAGLMLLLGPASVQVITLIIVVTMLYLWATRLRTAAAVR